jgi:hypothetical protein
MNDGYSKEQIQQDARAQYDAEVQRQEDILNAKPKRLNCCCSWGCAVSDEWPEFECYACPIHKAGLAQVDELCKRHTRERNAKGTVQTDDGRTLIYDPVWTEEDESQAKGRILRQSEVDWILSSPLLMSVIMDGGQFIKAVAPAPEIKWQTDFKREN